jgi:hypothetical protein
MATVAASVNFASTAQNKLEFSYSQLLHCLHLALQYELLADITMLFSPCFCAILLYFC